MCKISGNILGKSEVCDMTMMSGAFDKSIVDANNFLLKISEENDRHRYVCIGGDVIYLFLTNDNVYKNISNMGNILTPYCIAIYDETI